VRHRKISGLGHTDPLWRSSLSIDARSVIATRWRRLLTTSPIPF